MNTANLQAFLCIKIDVLIFNYFNTNQLNYNQIGQLTKQSVAVYTIIIIVQEDQSLSYQ